MTLNTHHLVNGTWTRRNVDLDYVLAANQEPESRSEQHVHIERPPTVGVMTRTIAHSPNIRWIVPARMRFKDKNDVLFVGVRLPSTLP